MIETNTEVPQFSFVAKGRELLERGDISSAVEYYRKAFDPDATDEFEARNMLIEARSHLSRKHIIEALECFEEALVMGTDVQRKQALEGITIVGQIASRLKHLNDQLQKGLASKLGRTHLIDLGLALVSDQENIILISEEAVEKLPGHLTKGSRITKLPQHLSDYPLPIKTDKCIGYIDEDDVKYILELVNELLKKHAETRPVK